MFSVRLDFDPSGLLFNAERSVLYLADCERHRIIAFDGAELRTFAELPPVEAGKGGLGQLANGRDVLFVSRFGCGSASGIFAISSSQCAPLVGLDPGRKRIGLAVAPDGVMFSSFFLDCHAPNTGRIASFTPDGEEIELQAELAKPVSLLVDRDSIVISDQARDRIVLLPRRGADGMTTLAELPQPDALCSGPEGSI